MRKRSIFLPLPLIAVMACASCAQTPAKRPPPAPKLGGQLVACSEVTHVAQNAAGAGATQNATEPVIVFRVTDSRGRSPCIP